MSGVVALELTIDSRGIVVAVETTPRRGSRGLSAVAGCVHTFAPAITFPTIAYSAWSKIRYPFLLDPATPAAPRLGPPQPAP